MAIPDFQSLMLPVLRRLAVARTTTAVLVPAMVAEFALTEAEQAVLLPSGRQPTFYNRVHWAIAYLKRAGLIDRPARATYEVSERGRKVLAASPARIDVPFLRQFPEFRVLRSQERDQNGVGLLTEASASDPTIAIVAEPATFATPDEQIEAAVAASERELRDELLRQVLAIEPRRFETLVLDLLGRMGYGDTVAGARERLGGSGDGGVDGVIREDRLGLDVIYLQAKRYREEASIAAEQVRAFAGALDDKGARKGVFITTSAFTRDAIAYAARQQQKRIVLIDGARLTELMLRYDVGVRPAREPILLKKLDLDYFEPDEAL